jgi:hypothetical protein
MSNRTVVASARAGEVSASADTPGGFSLELEFGALEAVLGAAFRPLSTVGLMMLEKTQPKAINTGMGIALAAMPSTPMLAHRYANIACKSVNQLEKAREDRQSAG